MKLNIGENIKNLRRRKDITQEELANILGVSYQTISRWENTVCYPDMELLPVIADFFGVTVDALLGVNAYIEKERTAQYLQRFQAAICVGDVDTCIAVAREGVAEYPNNYTLLNKLMYALFVSGDSDGNLPDWKENREKYEAEITELGERIMKYCPDQNIRLEATARLAFHHCEMGRKELGRKLYETLPELEYCKECNILWGLREEEKLPHDRDLIQKGYDILSAGLYSLTRGKLPDAQSLQVFQKILALKNLIFDDNPPNTDWRSAREHCEMAKLYIRMNQKKKALEALRLAAERARSFDLWPDTFSFDCLLLGTQTWNRTDFETSDSRPLCEILRDKWLAAPEFDSLRNTADFLAITETL